MDAISKIRLNDTEYEIKDEVARASGGNDSRIVTGTAEANETVAIEAKFGLFILCGVRYGDIVSVRILADGDYYAIMDNPDYTVNWGTMGFTCTDIAVNYLVIIFKE